MKRKDAILTSVSAFGALSLSLPADAEAPAQPIRMPKGGTITVGVIVGKGATVIDFAGPWEVFQDVTVPGDGKDAPDRSPFQIAMVSDGLDPLEATGGMIVKPRFTYQSVPAMPNVLVIGAQGEHTPAKIAFIKEAAKKADVVMSVCTGAFLLAQTGLLDGLHATTHHDFYDDFEKRFPAVHLVRGPRYVENGKIATAGGLSSGIELALRVVQRYFGNATASKTAYYMEYNRSSQRPTA
ncbi:MAG TPA: DJ-1/PfpI family protein [Candidatus Baltobacteraceae bacterium]|jgi:transcriptional regulator GlxA family with amidase domain